MLTLPITDILNETPKYKQVGILRSPPPCRAITKQQQQQQYPMTTSTRTLLDSQEVLPTQNATTRFHKSAVMKNTCDQGKLKSTSPDLLFLKAFPRPLPFPRGVVFVSRWIRPSASIVNDRMIWK
mmetsp:Transcript_4729/g.8714  ORF Transcript_4729/g.8714 Transcript_4729/m.8714 type:complete len:125 (+) Transcript_4729:194-568(+)